MTDIRLGEKQWYVVNTYSGHEQKVKTNLERRIVTMGMQDFIFNVVIAEKEFPVIKDGKPTGKYKMKNIYPGYIYVEMTMTDEAWFVIRNTPGVTGFVGSSGGGAKPIPVPREQIEQVLKHIGASPDELYTDYEVGNDVVVTRGAMEGATGKITSIDIKQGFATVSMVMFGRNQDVDVALGDLSKV